MFTIDVTRSNGRWRMRRAVNDSPAGVPILSMQSTYTTPKTGADGTHYKAN